jgi:hypothetical protein
MMTTQPYLGQDPKSYQPQQHMNPSFGYQQQQPDLAYAVQPQLNYSYPQTHPRAYLSPGSSTPPEQESYGYGDDTPPLVSAKGKADGGPGKWVKEAPVKNACLSCRTKKAKCDGQQPVCGQVS